MNLYDFLAYRNDCPICPNTQLATAFHSSRRQQIRTEDNRLVVLFHLDSIKKKHIDYKIGYSFGTKDDSFQAEFYTKDDKRFENDTPLFLIDRFKALDNNLKGYRFYKHCSLCRRYNYSSSRINLNLRQGKLENLYIKQESIAMIQPYTYKVFRMDNDFEGQNTQLHCWNATNDADAILDYSIPIDAMTLNLPLIPFISQEETAERIKTLLTFY